MKSPATLEHIGTQLNIHGSVWSGLIFMPPGPTSRIKFLIFELHYLALGRLLVLVGYILLFSAPFHALGFIESLLCFCQNQRSFLHQILFQNMLKKDNQHFKMVILSAGAQSLLLQLEYYPSIEIKSYLNK